MICEKVAKQIVSGVGKMPIKMSDCAASYPTFKMLMRDPEMTFAKYLDNVILKNGMYIIDDYENILGGLLESHLSSIPCVGGVQ